MAEANHEQQSTQEAERVSAQRKFLMFRVPPQFFVDELRFFLRDNPPENILLDLRYESTDESLRRAWGRALADFNETPPRFMRQYTFADCPVPYLLLKKAAAEALRSVCIGLMRNELEYNDGDQSFKINHQWKALWDWSAALNQEYETQRARVKYEINAMKVFGNSSSEFGLAFRDLGGFGDPSASAIVP